MRKIAFLVFILGTIPCVFSTPLDSLIEGTQAERLRRTGESISESQITRNPVLRLLPAHVVLRQQVNSIMNDLNPGIVAETLYLYRKPGQYGYWNETQRTALFNQMLGISTLTGIQYFSASRGTMRTFYEISHVIDNPSTGNRLPDPVFPAPPASLSIYARQNDLTFGDNIYRYSYITTRDIIILMQENLTSLTAGIIPAIGRGRLRSVIGVIDCGDSMLIYAVSMARAVSFPGIGDRISSSFNNRAEAVLQWFIGRANRVFIR